MSRCIAQRRHSIDSTSAGATRNGTIRRRRCCRLMRRCACAYHDFVRMRELVKASCSEKILGKKSEHTKPWVGAPPKGAARPIQQAPTRLVISQYDDIGAADCASKYRREASVVPAIDKVTQTLLKSDSDKVWQAFTKVSNIYSRNQNFWPCLLENCALKGLFVNRNRNTGERRV